MKVRLSINHKKANVKSVVLHSDAVIGRGADCNLRLASGQISRKHCQIIVRDDLVAIMDLGSSNGTFLNGQQLTANEQTKLNSGDELSIGSVEFLVEYHDPTAETAIHTSQGSPEAPVVTNSGNEETPAGGTPQFSEAPTVENEQSDIDIDELSDEELEALLSDEGFEEDEEQLSLELDTEDDDEDDSISAAEETVQITPDMNPAYQEEFPSKTEPEAEDDSDEGEEDEYEDDDDDDDEDEENIMNFLQDLGD